MKFTTMTGTNFTRMDAFYGRILDNSTGVISFPVFFFSFSKVPLTEDCSFLHTFDRLPTLWLEVFFSLLKPGFTTFTTATP